MNVAVVLLVIFLVWYGFHSGFLAVGYESNGKRYGFGTP